jgi:hypothetical protein
MKGTHELSQSWSVEETDTSPSIPKSTTLAKRIDPYAKRIACHPSNSNAIFIALFLPLWLVSSNAW